MRAHGNQVIAAEMHLQMISIAVRGSGFQRGIRRHDATVIDVAEQTTCWPYKTCNYRHYFTI